MQHKEYRKSIDVINEKLMVIILATIKENGAQKQYDILINLANDIKYEAKNNNYYGKRYYSH